MENFVNEIKEKIKSINTNDDIVYLLKKIDNDYCYLYCSGNVFFGRKKETDTNHSQTDTAYISLIPDILIDTIDGSNSLEVGYYELLVYHQNLDDIYFEIFCEICYSYAKDKANKYDFYMFFEKLVEIFKNKRSDINTNVIGLVGELILIKHVYENYNYNLAPYWHKPGSYSKFDFSLNDFNIEVKTTTQSGLTFILKHSQIFNNQINYLALISLIETGVGDSVNSLKEYFYTKPIFSSDIDFQIAFQSEISKINDISALNKGYTLEFIKMYLSTEIPTIENIPNCIKQIQYEYDFSYVEDKDMKDIFNK